jgi:transcriptional regulator with XRE-family HTH domain
MTSVQTLIDQLRTENPQYKDAESIVDAVHQVGALLGRMRTRKGWKQGELGKRLGISAARVSQLEGGALRDAPSLAMLMRFAQACGETIKVVASGEQAQPEQSQTTTSADIVSGLAELRGQIADLSRPQAEISALSRQLTQLQDEVRGLRAAVEYIAQVPSYVQPVKFRHGVTMNAGDTPRGRPNAAEIVKTAWMDAQMLNGMAMAAESVFVAAGMRSCKVSSVKPQIADDGMSVTYTVSAGQKA